MTRHHAKSNINALLTRNLSIDSDVTEQRHSLIMPLHYLSAKSNNKTHGQFECDVTWFYFCFGFVRPHAGCGCCSIICWRGWSFVCGGGGGRICLKSDDHRQEGWERFGGRSAEGGGLEN